MPDDQLSQAQAFWNATKGAGWSDEQTRARARQERGVVQIGGHYFFPDGSSIRDTVAAIGTKLVVQEREQSKKGP